MKLTVNNLGPITTETTIDFSKNLTIIAGPNSTGKSYLTYSLWKLLDGVTIMGKLNSYRGTQILDNDTNNALDDVATIFFNGGYYNKPLPKKLSKNLIQDIFTQCVGCQTEFNLTKEEIGNLFKHDGIENATVNFFNNIDLDTLSESFVNGFSTIDNTMQVNLTKKLFTYSFIPHINNKLSEQQLKERFIERFIDMVSSTIFDSSLKTVELATSERASAFLFWRSEADESDEIRFKNKDKKQSALYTEPVLSNIKFARYLGIYDRFRSYIVKEHPHIITELEILMGGILQYSDTKGVYFNKFKEGTLEIDTTVSALPFHMLSSSIRSLTYIYFHLKCNIEKNSIFIIDEPESYLHPKSQTKMAHIIAMLTNAGIQVIITTHSEFLIREIANLTMLNELEEQKQKKFISQYNYSEKALIKRTDINTYYYTDHTFKITDEDDLGIWIDTIDDTISTQGEIFDKLENAMIGIE